MIKLGTPASSIDSLIDSLNVGKSPFGAFLKENKVIEKFQEIDTIEYKQLVGLAGPNDVLQYFLDWSQILEDIYKSGVLQYVADKFVDVGIGVWLGRMSAIKDLQKKREIKSLSAVSEIQRHASKAPCGVTLTMALDLEQEGYRRNIGFNVANLDETEILKRVIALGLYKDVILQYIKLIDSVRNGVESSWEMNPDCSVAIEMDGPYPYLRTKLNGFFVKTLFSNQELLHEPKSFRASF